MIYTELESHRASVCERWRVVGLLWRIAGEPDLTRKQRWDLRLFALRTYAKPSARVWSYLVSREGSSG